MIVGRGITDRAGGAAGPTMWALGGCALYLLGGVTSLFITAFVVDPVLAVVGIPAEAGQIGLSIRNALHPLLWGVLVAVPSVPIGRRLIPGLRFSVAGWLVLVSGLVLASITWFLIEESIRARYEYVDLEYVGFSILAWPALVAVALSGWAAAAVPPGNATPLIVLVLLAAISLSIALVPSVLGAADGIQPENLPLAFSLLLDVAYATVVVVRCFRTRGEAQPA